MTSQGYLEKIEAKAVEFGRPAGTDLTTYALCEIAAQLDRIATQLEKKETQP